MPWADINQTSTQPAKASPREPARFTRPVPVVGKIHPSSHDSIPISIRGRVGNDPELLRSPGGRKYVRLRVASSRRGRDDAGNWHDIDTTWYTVYAWNQLASNIYYSIRKGHPVLVWGRLTISNWHSEEKGTKGTDLSIAASSVGHDLNLCVSQCMRPLRDVDSVEPSGDPSLSAASADTNEDADEEEGLELPDFAASGPDQEEPTDALTEISLKEVVPAF